MTDFATDIAAAYATDGPAIDLGRGVLDGKIETGARVQAPLAMMNRHGLIAGATGTGKTITAQLIAEQLSAAGVPVVIADFKGDVSGVGAPGSADGPGPKRSAELGKDWAPEAFPVEYLAVGGIGPGVPLRMTVSDFGPQLVGKLLGVNETQEQALQLAFRHADEQGLLLIDLADLGALLAHVEATKALPGVSGATLGVLQRSVAVLDAAEFFGEPQIELADLMRVAPDGRGVVSCVELPAVQDRPALWSTALMGLVAELFETLPEAGDLPKPKLVVFLDEAHLLFADATDAFLQSIEQTVRLIRSKGVGVFFITQTPKDVPESVLAQLGNRVQHALRAFTPADAKALKATVSTFPTSEVYDLEELLPALGIGEAAITILDDKGVPTPVVHSRLPAPRSRMGPADTIAGSADLMARYGTRLERESARERLEARVPTAPAPAAPEPEPHRAPKPRRAPAPKAPPSAGEAAVDFLKSSEGKRLVRGVFGMLRKRL